MGRLLKHFKEQLTSKFGSRTYEYPIGSGKMITDYHNGIDVVGEGGKLDDLVLIEGGIIKKNSYDNILGWYIEVSHGILEGYEYISRYQHMQQQSPLKINEYYSIGQVCGYMGKTGQVTGAHLHYALKLNENFVDPYKYVFENQQFYKKPYKEGTILYTTNEINLYQNCYDNNIVKTIPKDKQLTIKMYYCNTNLYAFIDEEKLWINLKESGQYLSLEKLIEETKPIPDENIEIDKPEIDEPVEQEKNNWKTVLNKVITIIRNILDKIKNIFSFFKK